MPDLGISVLFKGKNMIRLLGGLWVALKISLISVVISIPLGILLGIVMTWKNPVTKAVTRVYLEIVRIMPQMVLLFLVFFGTTRMFGWNLSAEFASVIVFTFWGTAEMGDLVRRVNQYPEATSKGEWCSAWNDEKSDLFLHYYPADPAASDPAVDQPGHPYDQDDKPCDDDRCGGGVKGDTADHRGKLYGTPNAAFWTVRNRVCTVFPAC